MNVTAVLYGGLETLDMFRPIEMLGSSGEFEVGFFSLKGGAAGKYGGPVIWASSRDIGGPWLNRDSAKQSWQHSGGTSPASGSTRATDGMKERERSFCHQAVR